MKVGNYSGVGDDVDDWHGARSYPISSQPFGTITAPYQVYGGDTLLCGFAFLETTGTAPCVLEIHDGGVQGGQLICPVSLNPGQSLRDWVPDPGILCKIALSVLVISGSVRGTLWVRDI